MTAEESAYLIDADALHALVFRGPDQPGAFRFRLALLTTANRTPHQHRSDSS